MQAFRIEKHLLALLMLSLAFVIFGCGDDDDDDDNGGSPTDDDVVDDDDDATDDDDDVTDDDDDTVDDDDDVIDDDDDDDITVADDYVAPWPTTEPVLNPQTYDETPTAGPLREKAEDYDLRHETWHQPDHGSCLHAYFTDDTYTAIAGYHGHGDSTIWTGTYMATQALRYWVTGDPQALANAVAKVHTLSGHLHVTGRPGFIGRFWGSQSSPTYSGDSACDADDRCHKVDTGDYAGDWWIGETSRDQYTGWFYGMGVAYDIIDDEDVLDIIRADVAEVLNELIDNNWVILDEAGEPTDAAPQVLPPMRVSWLLTGYHITGEPRFKSELQRFIKNSYRPVIRFESIAFFNRYGQYYGNNLAHTNFANLLRYGKVYLSEDDYQFFVDVFETQVHTFTRLSHNPWFTGIFMDQGDYVDTPGDEYHLQVVQDLTDFRQPPLAEYYLPDRDPLTYTLDPISVTLTDLQTQFPFLVGLLGTWHYQSNEPATVDLQCPGGFMFQWNPYRIYECGNDTPTKVHSGHDYLAAYWLAAYNKAVTKDQ